MLVEQLPETKISLDILQVPHSCQKPTTKLRNTEHETKALPLPGPVPVTTVRLSSSFSNNRCSSSSNRLQSPDFCGLFLPQQPIL